jgi:acyl-coenzyme A synthetase/AMP-(fatty) acid ligase
MDLPERCNVAEYFVDRHLEEGHEDQVAVLCGEEQFTYRQISELVSRTANALGQYGVGKGDRVLILLPDSPAFVAAFWGAIKLGAVAVPVNTLLTGEELEFVLRDSGARCLVAHDSLLDKVDPVLRTLGSVGRADCGRSAVELRVFVAGGMKRGHEDFDGVLARSARHAGTLPVTPDEVAFWLYTSGSTGQPKAVIHRHRDMLCCLENFAKGVLGMTAKDRAFSASKLFFAYGLGNGLYFPFGAGAQTVLLPERANAERVLEVISRYHPTLFFAVPHLYAAILEVADASRYDLSSLRCAVSAGEALPAPLWERFHERFAISILDGIGSTEMLHMFISNRLGDLMPGSSGKIVPGYEDGRFRQPLDSRRKRRGRILEPARAYEGDFPRRLDRDRRQVPMRWARLLLALRAYRRYVEGPRDVGIASGSGKRHRGSPCRGGVRRSGGHGR